MKVNALGSGHLKLLDIAPTIAFVSVCAFLTCCVDAGRYERIVVFGESLSDAGNQLIASEGAFPPSPPYFDGRWSNGPIWIDLVSAQLGLGYTEPSLGGGSNYAFGGARSGFGEVIVNCANLGLTTCFDLPSPSYGTQIDTFLASQPDIDERNLFVLWGGGNDLFAGIDPQIIADNLTQHVMTLLEHGAHDIVLLNMFAGIGHDLNRLLTPRMISLRHQYPQARLVEVDIPTMTREFFDRPSKWGITTFGTPALDTQTLEVVENPDAYLSWDGIHVTAAFNRVIADYVLRTMDPVLLRRGDFDSDEALTIVDIDALSAATRAREPNLQYDLNFDGAVNLNDLHLWVKDFRQTWFGDANLDGEFNSTDLLLVFQAGGYEDTLAMNSGWSTGDWNADGDFGTADLTLAFQDGGYERGPRVSVAAVPEPATFLMLVTGILCISLRRRSHVSRMRRTSI